MEKTRRPIFQRKLDELNLQIVHWTVLRLFTWRSKYASKHIQCSFALCTF